MDVRQLEFFVAVAEEGSFTRAAERSFVSQPGLSVSIRSLERELGAQAALGELHADLAMQQG
jgi:DNA-binding transcriptional LysR family regulator